MANERKRMYFIQIKTSFFNDPVSRRIRREPDGALLQVIYLKLLVLSANSGGEICLTGLFDTPSEEIAGEIEEKPEDLKRAMELFKRLGLVVFHGETESSKDIERISLIEFEKYIGSECDSAARVRTYRNRKRQANPEK